MDYGIDHISQSYASDAAGNKTCLPRGEDLQRVGDKFCIGPHSTAVGGGFTAGNIESMLS